MKVGIGDLVIAEDEYSGERFVAMITSKGYESSLYIEDRPVRVERVTNYRSLRNGRFMAIIDKQILEVVNRGSEDVKDRR